MKRLIGIGWLLLSPTLLHADRLQAYVPTGYTSIAHRVGVPPTILYVLALTESGRPHNGVLKPWPWTLNIAGKGHYYASRQAAVDAAQHAMADGITNIDMGFLQVNWQANGQANFTSVSDALDPYRNLAVGAALLRNHHQHTGDWLQAVGRYRSTTDTHATEQRERFAAHLARLVVADDDGR